jgi:hypothetical protein
MCYVKCNTQYLYLVISNCQLPVALLTRVLCVVGMRHAPRSGCPSRGSWAFWSAVICAQCALQCAMQLQPQYVHTAHHPVYYLDSPLCCGNEKAHKERRESCI